MATLGPLAPERRPQVAADLGLLAGLYVSLGVGQPPALTSSRKAELRQLYESTLLPIFAPLVVRDRSTGESPSICAGRVARLLAAWPTAAASYSGAHVCAVLRDTSPSPAFSARARLRYCRGYDG